ncbi:hypothetical protein E2C01_099822 [Portunus trituberculatus]|uniref:Uncharacterized protein n=1 Tax=Portunus trituberculatus TaxID=210409 RepID=A0A5B7KGC2_PORTR|nr:hypothetical protein [Portunus trituberculatus]
MYTAPEGRGASPKHQGGQGDARDPGGV